MEDKHERVWEALVAKADEVGAGGAFGLVGQNAELARSVVMEVAPDAVGNDHERAGQFLSNLCVGKVAEIVRVPEL